MPSGSAPVDVKIPHSSDGPQLDVDMTVLPLELVDSFNHAYFLHLLATDPAQVLPPGKSLLSVLSRSPAAADGAKDAESIQNKVEQMMRKAFWNEAVESLANPAPSVQLARLGHLYKDLHEALKPLLPAHHPLLRTLAGPLSPTSAPLRSAMTHLRAALRALRERCAPARDPQVDALAAPLDADTGRGREGREEAEAVVAAVRGTLELAEVVRDDLANFVVGALPEAQLAPLIRQQARAQERAVVLGLWDAAAVRALWGAWLGAGGVGASAGTAQLTARVVEALGAPDAVACHLPRKDAAGAPVAEPAPNALPPPFLLSSPALFYLQNFLQAIVIAAALRVIAQLPPAAHKDGDKDKDKGKGKDGDGDAAAPDFMPRIWALLLALIPARRTGGGDEGGDGDGEDDSPTRLVNLEDEVLRARRIAAAPGPSESSHSDPPTTTAATNATNADITAADERALRAAVQRTLQTADPVFKLLQTRLLAALSARLAEPRAAPARVAPAVMQTGKDGGGRDADGRPAKRPRLSLGLDSDDGERPLVVKGFEDPLLVGALAEAVRGVRRCVAWVEGTWGATLAP
ncbi:hypothetical protein FIBSPDRAFT_920337 [Athelia psychrophila]|uniref:Uncharacterized protein n=1 Tax=Athelia psychrophila TaxID=1759441 RepID=A0A166HD44_9AGAM|nr:hypothetical protein FIBSPDRAFT_920337 [Fibularhizoctonia sp. CBS 109695]